MKINKNIIILAFFGAILSITFFTYFWNNQGIKLVGSDEFNNLISNGEVFVLQVHTPYYGEIEGTDLVLEDWENVENYLDKLPKDKSSPISVYCRSGRMSGIVSEKLSDLGYSNVYDLEGGMNAWESSGRKLAIK